MQGGAFRDKKGETKIWNLAMKKYAQSNSRQSDSDLEKLYQAILAEGQPETRRRGASTARGGCDRRGRATRCRRRVGRGRGLRYRLL
jgi:hypothetical protein